MTLEEIEQQHSGAAYIVTRDVVASNGVEYHEGHLLWPYNHWTYGSISPAGVAVSEQMGEIPFFEVPVDAVRIVGVD